MQLLSWRIVIFLGATALAGILARLLFGLKARILRKYEKDGKTAGYFSLKKTLDLAAYGALGLGWLGAATYWTYVHYSFYGNAKTATGVVVRVGDPSTETYRSGPLLIVKFTDRNNRVVYATVDNSFKNVPYHVGDPLEVYYRPDREEVARIEDQFGVVWLFFLVALLFLFGGWIAVHLPQGPKRDEVLRSGRPL